MNQKSLSILEFNKITERLSKEASTSDGKHKCQKLQPGTNIKEIKKSLGETRDAVSRIFSDGTVSFCNAKNVTASCKRLKAGGALNIEELLRIKTLLEATAKVKDYGRKINDRKGIAHEIIAYEEGETHNESEHIVEGEQTTDLERIDSLCIYFDTLQPLSNLNAEIGRCIISEDEIADDASSGLKEVRRHQRVTNDRIHTQLTQLVSGSLRTYLQEAVITMRGDRYCIPVKAEYKSQVPGMIHDQSSTGSTLFIEPSSIVKLNNELKELILKEEQEIQKILEALSMQCAQYTEEILENYNTLVELDFIFAKGRLALSMNASMPIYGNERIMELKKARHPLLDPKSVVPVDIKLGESYSMLVITGPNTGGKTVSLKTCGLLAMMGQAGLFIPCADRSRLPVFNEIYADIGDEQSIEQSLSTFSSHMKNIVYILKHADNKSLCLFDELCAGTDPTEGAALAIAILREILGRGGLAMSTTHYSELKIFALTEKGVENGCCEFDVNTLSPTYKLLVGIPGKSNAFAISGKLGLPVGIIENAKTNLTESDKSFEDVITELEVQRQALEKEREKAEEFKRQAQSMKDKSRTQSEKIEEGRDRILEEAKEQARAILQEAKATADETIRNFQKYGSVDQIKEMEKDRERIRNSMKKAAPKALSMPEKKSSKAIDPAKLKKGDMVRVLSMNVNGTVSSLPDAKGNLFVQCGILRSQVSIRDIELIDENALNTGAGSSSLKKKSVPGAFGKGGGNISKMRMSKAQNISGEINLIGKKVDEAIYELDKYLDDAYLSHMTQVRVVHGKGTGALRNAVHQYLRKSAYISEFRIAEYGEGDAGVTIAVFK